MIFAIGDGSCAIFDNKIYGLYYFEHEPLTENDVTRLKAFDYDEVIKINVKQW